MQHVHDPYIQQYNFIVSVLRNLICAKHGLVLSKHYQRLLLTLIQLYYYTVCYLTCIFYAVVRQFSMLFIDNKDSVFCIL